MRFRIDCREISIEEKKDEIEAYIFHRHRESKNRPPRRAVFIGSASLKLEDDVVSLLAIEAILDLWQSVLPEPRLGIQPGDPTFEIVLQPQSTVPRKAEKTDGDTVDPLLIRR